ncbi:hypothetical protein ACVWZK_008052 [Bradyrhizobium sp. GM0.4]
MSATTNRSRPGTWMIERGNFSRSSSLATRPAQNPAFMSIWILGKARSALPQVSVPIA